MDFLNIKEKLSSFGFKMDIKNEDQCIFQSDKYRLKFINQRFEGWECYLYYDKDFKKFIPIGFMVFIFSKTFILSEYVEMVKKRKINVNINNIIFDEGGLMQIIKDNKLEKFIFFYQKESNKIYSKLSELNKR